MEEAAIVLMLKEKESGFLTKELGCYTVSGKESLLDRIYAEETDDGIVVHMALGCEKEAKDWEYDAIFDYYDADALQDVVDTVAEEEGHLNPVWVVTFPFVDEAEAMEQRLSAILQAHDAELQSVYASSEAEIRSKLETTINEIFKTIYEGGLSLTIDEKYHISVYADDYDGDVETSTAQSISVIFAFITGIIKMARDNRNATYENAKLLSSEPYPLVMDAPLSTFDKRRIKTVCESLPNTADQVIIFIKDTDGELAEEYMGDKIGSRHYFDKKNEFETILV